MLRRISLVMPAVGGGQPVCWKPASWIPWRRAQLLVMTVSMRVMSAGDGYRYLLRSVALGDGDRPLSTPLTRYYNAEGTPLGRWMGNGLPALGKGRITSGDEVSEAQLQLLVGMGCDPVTGAPLGWAYPVYKSVRSASRTAP